MHVCACVHVSMCVHACMCLHACVCMHACVCACIHVCVRTCMQNSQKTSKSWISNGQISLKSQIQASLFITQAMLYSGDDNNLANSWIPNYENPKTPKLQNSKIKTQNSKLKTQNSNFKTQISKLKTQNSK